MAKDLRTLRNDFVTQLQVCEKNLETLQTQREQLRGAIFAMDQVLSVEAAPPAEVPAAAPAAEAPAPEAATVA